GRGAEGEAGGNEGGEGADEGGGALVDRRGVHLRVVAQVDALRRLAAEGPAHEVLPQLLGREGEEGREQPREPRQAFVERPVRVELVGREAGGPEAVAAAAHGPLRERGDAVGEDTGRLVGAGT